MTLTSPRLIELIPFGDSSILLPIEFSQNNLTSNAKLTALIFTERGLNFFWT